MNHMLPGLNLLFDPSLAHASPADVALFPASSLYHAAHGAGGHGLVVVGIVIAVAYLLFHAGHAHSTYRHGRAHGHRGANLYWSSARGPWISIPGPFGTRIGHRL